MLGMTRAAYRTQHRAMALQAALFGEALRLVATRRIRRRDASLGRALAVRFEALMARDLANVEAGLYPRRLLFQMPVARYARRLPALLGDLPRVALRARRRDFRDLPAEVDLAVYPPYYRRNFHWQTDGYLSRRSAELYDLGVELLFGGTADVMRRQVIPPVSRLLAAEPRAGARLVDLACGTGRTLRQIAVAHPDLALLGVDLSRYYLDEARGVLRHRRATLAVANAEAMPLASGSVDAVTCVYLLHELPLDARRRVLAEARRVLRPGGVLAIEDACQPADSPELAGALAQFQRDLHEPYFKSYLQHPIADLAGEAGFEVESVEPHLVSVVVVARANG
ncbi:MAG TPA: methyltransferase domain-containing protein [Kofleriaceae bacterium]|jgi:ubiquinone/menaquinone biosynthesis C-methylase UbiE